ncbi:TULIP family P47-like protein [Fibrella aquatilis]|uniref:TULIP family P47-like protein n=1 Tax=Fibrella aquatilis TaxID=2817059 RepID=A0A939G1C5_9BACT|nr:TULIP family P47-like protein [Fibrella aquatilis]MBO0930061.1 TULIP family P47-like protein [Fibrella aquatilis]
MNTPGNDISGEISTFGWDTVFAVRIDNVNAAIASHHTSPTTFSYTDPADANVYCSGGFGTWSVVRGGDGGGVNVQIPLEQVTGQMNDNAAYVAYTCAAASVIVTVRLTYFDTSQPTQQNLKVNPVSTSPDVPVVELYSSDFSTNPVVPAYAVYALQAAVMNWCTANLAAFEHVFSVIDINGEADTGDWAFLKPTSVSYAYVDGPTDDDAFLGVLTMTTGTPSGGLQQVLDTRIVQGTEEGAFCLSRGLLMNKLILPNLQLLWPNLQTGQVTISDDTLQLNPNESVALPQTQYQGNTYTPQLNEFTLTIEGAQLTIDAYTETVVQDGVTAWCRNVEQYTIVKGTNSSGQTTLAYQAVGTPQTSNGHYIAEWVQITDTILAVVLGIALAALAILSGGAAVPIIAIVGALIVGAVALSPTINGMIQNNDAPAIDLLQENIYAPIVWTDSQAFAVSTVDLNGSLRLGGALGFTTAPPSVERPT